MSKVITMIERSQPINPQTKHSLQCFEINCQDDYIKVLAVVESFILEGQHFQLCSFSDPPRIEIEMFKKIIPNGSIAPRANTKSFHSTLKSKRIAKEIAGKLSREVREWNI